jgi:hypothetical protein
MCIWDDGFAEPWDGSRWTGISGGGAKARGVTTRGSGCGGLRKRGYRQWTSQKLYMTHSGYCTACCNFVWVEWNLAHPAPPS